MLTVLGQRPLGERLDFRRGRRTTDERQGQRHLVGLRRQVLQTGRGLQRRDVVIGGRSRRSRDRAPSRLDIVVQTRPSAPHGV